MAPHILNIGTQWWWMVRSMPQIYLKEKIQPNSAYVIHSIMRSHFQSGGFKTNLIAQMVLE